MISEIVNTDVVKSPGSMLEPIEKFALLADIGIVTVPFDYEHPTALETFDTQNRKKFAYYNGEITDKNFPNPTRILKPGDRFFVRAWRYVAPTTPLASTTPQERMAFLATQKAIHTGAQGLSLVFNERRSQLPKDNLYASFDEEDRLYKDADGCQRMPYLFCGSGSDFEFRLGFFRSVGCGEFTCLSFLCFTEVEPESLDV